MSVITSRALPDVRDGLKPVQRRILYAMFSDLRVTSDGRYIKCAAVVGEVMKSYHPHGDQSIYDALVRMAQSFSLRYPLVEGYGNFRLDRRRPARRDAVHRVPPDADLEELALSELRDQTVDFRPNYASTTEEPEVLPAQFPNLLVNGASGIAVGMATNIPPHNLKEVCKALDALLEDRDTADREAHPVHQGARLPDRRRDPQHAGRDPPDLCHGAGGHQAPGDLRARPGQGEHHPGSRPSPTGSRRTPWSAGSAS